MAKSLTVSGPYPNRAKWRLVIRERGARKSVVVPSREEAEALKDRLLSEAVSRDTPTVGALLDSYHEGMLNIRSVLPQTAANVHAQLTGWLPLELPITALSAERAERLYIELTHRVSARTGRPLAVTTQHLLLALAKGWGKWLVKQHVLATNPFADIQPVGKRRAGKTQLRIDEAQRFAATALDLAKQGDASALGVLIMLHLGLRQGEVGARTVRDLDADGRVLWISHGKTVNATRRLKLPENLRPLLLQLASGKRPHELLFSDSDQPPHRHYWWSKVRALCVRAGVPVVCPHSLRGLHATLALEAGATADMVARALGHGSFEITARHYASAESVEGARLVRVAEALAPVLSPEVTQPAPAAKSDRIADFLGRLSPDELDELRRRLR